MVQHREALKEKESTFLKVRCTHPCLCPEDAFDWSSVPSIVEIGTNAETENDHNESKGEEEEEGGRP
jgi:hypothetical protein